MAQNKNPQEERPVVLPPQYYPYYPPQEDEIDLRELWETIKKRKRTILWSVLIALILASIYLWRSTPIYEAKATVAVGKQLVKTSDGLMIEKFFDDPAQLKEMLDVMFGESKKSHEDNVTSYIKSIEIPKNIDGFISIHAMGPSNEDARRELSKPLEFIFQRGERYKQGVIDQKTNRLKALESRLRYLQTIELDKLKKALELTLTMQIPTLENKIRLVREIDTKKIEERIHTLQNIKIPSIEKKIAQARSEISKKENSLKNLQSRMKESMQKDPALAALTAMQIANLQNDITHLRTEIINLQVKIKEIEELTIPDLLKKKKRILEETIPNLEKQKASIIEKTIPAQKAAIHKLTSITIPSLQAQIMELKTSMKPPYIEETKIVGKIYTSEHPVKPKKKLILIVSILTGLILGIFLAFFLEFIGKEREES